MRRARSTGQRSLGGRIQPEVALLIAITLIVSVGGMLGGGALRESLVLNPALVLRGEVWRLITWVFVEREVIPLVFGCLILYWFGGELSSVWGPRGFLVRYLGVAAAAGALATVSSLVLPSARAAVYAGGMPAASAMVIAWSRFFPERQIRLYFVLPVSGRMLLYFTIAMTLVWAAFMGATPFLPHLFAEAIALAYLGVLRPRTAKLFILRVRLWLVRAKRKTRVRSSHLKSVRRDGKGDGDDPDDNHPRRGSDPDRQPPHYWN